MSLKNSLVLIVLCVYCAHGYSNFTLSFSINPPTINTSQSFGWAVATYQGDPRDGETLVVGAPAYCLTPTLCGSIYVYRRAQNDIAWTLTTSNGLQAWDGNSSTFGDVVAVDKVESTYYIAVGDPSFAFNMGKLWLYASQDGVTWQNIVILYPESQAANSYFASTIDIAGGHLVVGAYGEGNGAVYVWDLVGNNVTNRQKIVLDSNVTKLGSTVVMGGNYMLATALSTQNQGYVYFFSYSTVLKNWTLTDQQSGGPEFGGSLDVDADGVAIVGDFTSSPGTVNIYRINIASQRWGYVTNFSSCPTPCPADFKFGLDLSLALNYILVSANDRVYLYSRQGTNVEGIFDMVLPNQKVADNNNFAIDLVNNFGVVGAPFHDNAGVSFPLFTECYNSQARYGQNCDQSCPCPANLCNTKLSADMGRCTQPSNNNAGAIVGGVFGAIIGVVIIALIVRYVLKTRQERYEPLIQKN